jgi:outer membrane protein
MKQIMILYVLIQFQNVIAQKICFIDESKLLKATLGYEQSIKEMDSIKQVFTQEIKQSKEKLDDKINQLLVPYKFDQDSTLEQIKAKLSETDNKKLELLQEESQLLNKQAVAKEEEYKLLYQQKVGSILEKVNKSVKEYCNKNKIEILYKINVLQQALAYYDESKDVTEAIIVLVKK